MRQPSRARYVLAAAVACGAATAGCGNNATTPTPVKTPVVSTVPATPTPTPTPTPKASATLPPGMKCGEPVPTTLMRMALKVHARDGNRIVLDSKPLVANVNGFCDKAGYGDWKFCETRPEGHPERAACDYLVVGIAPGTGRWGPTWYFGSELCGTNPENCAHHPNDQFLTVAKKKGTYVACAAESVPVAQGGSRCGEIEIQ